MKICEDPRHGKVCYPDECQACQEECDPKYWREVKEVPNGNDEGVSG